jgi:hypothetical protein
MPNLMERKSTRRVENGAAQPTSVSNKSVNWRYKLPLHQQSPVGPADDIRLYCFF